MRNKNLYFSFTAIILLSFILVVPSFAATYYVRGDGGTATQCTGRSDAAYPGTGTGQACAFNHPFWAISPVGNNPTKMVGGDTLIVDGSNGAQYKIGLGAPNTSDTSKCGSGWPWDCVMRRVPSGPDATTPTRILGKGYDTGCVNPPQLWGNERAIQILDLRSSNNVELQCLDITDHSDCQQFGPNPCNRNSFPYGSWAATGIEAADSTNVVLKNINIHGLWKGIHAGRLKDWTIEDTKIVSNSFVGWDGDIGANVSSNSGTMTFNRVTIEYNGCGETYPGKQPYNCYSQDQGGYGDGLGTHQTGANWVFNNCNISHNVSDGIDLLYHDGNGTVTVKRTRAEGNAGNQVKSATNTVIENSVIVSNCAYFKDNPITWKTSTFNHCRAFGNTLALSFRNAGMSAAITDSTLIGNGDNLILSMGAGCNGTEVLKSRNNVFLGGPDYGGGDTTGLYYASGATGNGDGPCGTLKIDDDYSIIYGTKTLSSDCNGKAHSICQDPKMAEPIVSYYKGNAYNVNLQTASPGITKALVVSGASSLDYNSYDRGAVWDVGALEYGSVPGSSTTSSTPSCGDSVCNGTETCSTCSGDCGTCAPVCGDAVCNGTETCSTCSGDCGACPPVCGDTACNGTETCSTCSGDCGVCPPVCGDHSCNGTETCSSCSTDCGACPPPPPVCGDGSCNGTETCSTCAGDCGVCPPVCGDKMCNGTETCSTCAGDCGVCPPVCGDKMCNGTETCSTCAGDCGVCAPVCGDKMCNGTETCSTCAGDCGVCPAVCGNGKVEGTEQCDDGNRTSGDGCSSSCLKEYAQPACGNGKIEGTEQCDDGNRKNWDGCSRYCKIETTKRAGH